jgi:hypothetical protein
MLVKFNSRILIMYDPIKSYIKDRDRTRSGLFWLDILYIV